VRRRVRFAIFVALSLLPITGTAQTSPEARYERPIVTAGPGPQRLAVDEALLTGGGRFRVFRRGELFLAEEGLADLRLFTDSGRPVPYLLVQPALAEPVWIDGRLLSVAATKTTSGFELDLGAQRPVDMVRVEGLPAPYLKRLSLEGSGDRQRWTMLAAEATLFDLPDERLRQNTLGFAPGDYQYLRITWNDANSGRLPSPRAAFARRAVSAPRPPATTIKASVERRPSEPGVSRFRVRLPAAGLPIVALDLEVGRGHVYRRASVTESRLAGLEAAPVELGSATLARVTRDGATATDLRVPIATPTEAEIELTIDDGANEPLDIRSISVVLAQLPWIFFEAPPSGGVVAKYGDQTLQRPSYDLEAVRGAVDLSKLPEARWADGGHVRITLTRVAGAPPPVFPPAGPALDPAVFKYSRAIETQAKGLAVLPLDAHALAHSRGPGNRFADVRLLDGANQQVPYLLERRNEPLSVDLTIKPTTAVQAVELKPRAGSPQRSVYVISLPEAQLPPATIVVETSARVFQRTARLGFDRAADRDRRDPWFEVTAAQTWRHADEQTPARPLALRVGTLAERELRLVIDEGDNQPLPITAVRLLLPSYRLRFYHPAEASVRLLYGRDDLQAPQYDLALLAPRVMGAAASDVRAGAAAGAAAPPSAFVSPRIFWIILSVAVLVLLGLIVRLVRGQGDQAAEKL
jgi:Protein of unknown function (DUF3999)